MFVSGGWRIIADRWDELKRYQDRMDIDNLTINVALSPEALKLREKRLAKNLSFGQVEKDTGISHLDLMRYEMGQLIPSKAIYKKLLKYYS